MNPHALQGDLTLLGQTHPVTLTVERFNCYHSPIWQTEVCGGDFSAEIDRTQWGMDFFVDKGMSKTVNLQIQAEAVKQ
nr:YceI family protein [Wohlfahrtiimonas chitiniclastica]